MTVRSCVWAPTSSRSGDGRCTEAHELSAKRRISVATEELVCAASELPPGKVTGVGPWAVGNSKGDYFAVTRRCRHLYADLAGGTIDSKGCLVCPWHGSRYAAIVDFDPGRMMRSASPGNARPGSIIWSSTSGSALRGSKSSKFEIRG
jgi:nitrite reductase/ring-hydroxylating ferredoxin subunit